MLYKENPEACGFGSMHKNVIAWAELPKPFIPDGNVNIEKSRVRIFFSR